jgi:hypothetical protein
VILGNPPDRRRTSDNAARALLDGFVSGEGIHRKNLYNDYVYFWRWALRVACDARRGAAVVCFVTAAAYIRGPAFGGLRQKLRQSLDDLWLIDLEGDQRAARATDNVFPIRTPVAIALGVRYGPAKPEAPAFAWYARLQGRRDVKLAALESIRSATQVQWRPASSGWADSLTPTPGAEYASWPALTDLFPWQVSGAQLKRTWPIGPTPDVLQSRWQRLLELPLAERRQAFGPTRDRDLDSAPADLVEPATRLEPLTALRPGSPSIEPVRYAYRSFDRQWVVPDARLGDFMRPSLWRSSGPRQMFLTSLLTNVLGHGPAAVATAHVPDLDHFRGSFGARAVIPLWRDAAATRPNVAEAWLATLSARYGFQVDAEALFAYCYALLATRGYVQRFAEELRVPGARLPLTLDQRVFRRAVDLGSALLALHTYREVRVGKASLTGSAGNGFPRSYVYDSTVEMLRIGDGRLEPITRDVWEYAVSGYRVIPGWLRQRLAKTGRSPLDAIRPTEWTPTLSRELLELVWLIEATLALEPQLDEVLDQAIASSRGPYSSRR